MGCFPSWVLALTLLRIAILFTVTCTVKSQSSTTSSSVLLHFRNDWNETLEVGWVDPASSQSKPLSRLAPNSTLEVSSFLGHEFQVSQYGACEDLHYLCSRTRMVASRSPHQLSKNFHAVEVKDFTTLAPVVPDKRPLTYPGCRMQAKTKLSKLARYHATTYDDTKKIPSKRQKILQEYQHCLKHEISPILESMHQEVSFQHEIREYSSRMSENVTCTDPGSKTTRDESLRVWTSDTDRKSRTVHVKLDRPASRIHVIESFADPKECLAIENAAEEVLAQAHTADGKGGSVLNPNRKAMQAALEPDWSKEPDGGLMARLKRRIFEYAEHELQMNLTEHGQEPLMNIQYKGRGRGEFQPDRYTPHCDGTCDGRRFMVGKRMATMVVYCTVPDEGGGTNFQNANVHVEPAVGSAVFFSYLDPQTMMTDHRLTSHSGCPVYEVGVLDSDGGD
eukprot:Nitzschia sp. Nitz4//scaffold135_size62275//19086//20846//NITZ4_006347-RA/size62275-processed-gene-0.4-mRNA-1//1//CDS//3329535554//5263//frame0